jgi:hypothetical protein
MFRFVARSVALVSLVYAPFASAKFLPDNNLHLQKLDKNRKINVSQQEFTAAMAKTSALYADTVAAHGGNLDIVGDWDDETVNAYADQQGATWEVHMYGGLARRPEVTLDGFLMVICHELGHHLGGYFFYSGSWAAAEGQADYFATQACARELWKGETTANAAFRNSVDPTAKTLCDRAWAKTPEQDLCYRTAMAGKSLGDLLAALGGDTVNFDTPDENQVSSSDDAHPAAQCRLDTYTAGALCTVQFDKAVIPGIEDGIGENNRNAETAAERVSCTQHAQHTFGFRPRCWFKPLLGTDAELVSSVQ